MSLVGGGVGTWLLSWSWANYFRERDYLADNFVVACNLKDELIAYLEENRFYDTSVPFMLNWQPANEQRIDKLATREVIPNVEEIPSEPIETAQERFDRRINEVGGFENIHPGEFIRLFNDAAEGRGESTEFSDDDMVLFERAVRESRLNRPDKEVTHVVEEKPDESVVSLSARLLNILHERSTEELENLDLDKLFDAVVEVKWVEDRKGDVERELPAWVKEYIEEVLDK